MDVSQINRTRFQDYFFFADFLTPNIEIHTFFYLLTQNIDLTKNVRPLILTWTPVLKVREFSQWEDVLIGNLVRGGSLLKVYIIFRTMLSLFTKQNKTERFFTKVQLPCF